MKTEQLRDLSEDELIRKKAELKDQLFKLRFQHELGQLDTTGQLRSVRRDIARIETILAEIRRPAK
ncbi:MAG: 50S ribosomal protein L29 [Candidatus Aminicenantes bacterium]|nr:50S ribosomal protein L29 [Candidatus Aminicenantes bacterium]